MNDLGRVGGPQADQRLPDERRQLTRRDHPQALDALGQFLTVQILHDHVAVAVGQRPEVEHLEDVIASDPTSRLRLALEALEHRLVTGSGRMQDLDGDTTRDERVHAFEHAAHPALTDQPDDAILPIQDLTEFQAHDHLRLALVRLEHQKDPLAPDNTVPLKAAYETAGRLTPPSAAPLPRPPRAAAPAGASPRHTTRRSCRLRTRDADEAVGAARPDGARRGPGRR